MRQETCNAAQLRLLDEQTDMWLEVFDLWSYVRDKAGRDIASIQSHTGAAPAGSMPWPTGIGTRRICLEALLRVCEHHMDDARHHLGDMLAKRLDADTSTPPRAYEVLELLDTAQEACLGARHVHAAHFGIDEFALPDGRVARRANRAKAAPVARLTGFETGRIAGPVPTRRLSY